MSFYVYLCILFLLLSVLFSAFLIAVNVLILVEIVPGTSTVAQGMSIVLRIFTILLALLSIVAKKENQFLSRYLFILDDWKGIGLLDIFMAVLTLSSIPGGAPEWMNITIQVAGWGVCGLGAFFFILGLVGGKRAYKNGRAKPAPPA